MNAKRNMINAKKGITLVATVLTLMMWLLNTAFANGILPFADSVFTSAGVSLSNQIDAIYSAKTKAKSSEIIVSSCTLQIKDGSRWVDSTSLTAPSTVAKNTISYKATGSYSSSCTSGNTYRIKAVFDADGHQLTRYSNEVAY
ncbi:MAG: hypothetical protein RSE23_01360 [Clostridia bacterium]